MFRIVLAAAVAAGCVWLSAATGEAQAQKAGKKEAGQFATVVKVDGADLIVTVRDRKAKKDVERTIKVDKDVKVVSIKEGFRLADLKAGDEVLLVEKGGKVTEIRVVTAPK